MTAFPNDSASVSAPASERQGRPEGSNAASAAGFYIPKRVREDQKSRGLQGALELLEQRERQSSPPAAPPPPGRPPGASPRPPRRRAPQAPAAAAEASWLRVDQVAKRLNLDKKYIYRLIDSGQLQAVNFGKRMWRVREDMMQRFIQERAELSLGEVAERWDRAAERSRSAAA